MHSSTLKHYIKNNGKTEIIDEPLEDIQAVSKISSMDFEVDQLVYDRLIKQNAKGSVINGKFFITTFIAKIKSSNEEKNYFAISFEDLRLIRQEFKRNYSTKLISQASNLIDTFQAKKVRINFN
jgi:hypothetical protein